MQLSLDLKPQDDNLIRLMLDKSAARNNSRCGECRLYSIVGAYGGFGTCSVKEVVSPSDLTCYKAQF